MRSRFLALSLLASAWVFGILTEDTVNQQQMSAVDLKVSSFLRARATPFFSILMLAITYFGSLAVTGGIALASGLVLWWRGQSDRVWLLSFAVPTGMLINGMVKLLVNRPRPVFENPLLTLSSYSFPSGHAMAATVVYGLFAAFALQTSRDLQHRIAAVSIAALLIGLVCFSRLYLGVHYLTDVLAGIAEGIAWLACCLALVRIKQQRSAGAQKNT